MKLTSFGILVVGTDDALYGVKPETGEQLWSTELLKKVKVEEYDDINGTSYVAFKRKVGFAEHQYIINVASGKLVFDSKNQKLPSGEQVTYMFSREYISELNSFYFVYNNQKGKTKHLLYDIANEKVMWEVLLPYKAGEVKITPILYGSTTNLLCMTGKGVYTTEIATGNIKKLVEIKNNPAVPPTIYPDPSNGIFYVNHDDGFNCYRVSDGSQVWTTPKVAKTTASFVLFNEKYGLFLGYGDDINLYDIATGAPKWAGKDIDLRADVRGYTFTDKGLALYMSNDKYNGICLLDYQTGKPLNKKPLKIPGRLSDLRLVSKGLLYLAGGKVNVYDLETGKDVFDSDIKLGLSYTYCDYKNKIYYFTDKNLVVFDPATSTSETKKFSAGFEGSEMPGSCELRGENILLKSSQNLSMISGDGSVVWHKYYKAPGQSTGAKFALGAAMVLVKAAEASQNMSNYGQAQAAANSSGNSQSYTVVTYNISGLSKEFNKKFKATKQSDNYVTILTKVEDGTEKGIGVVRLNKDSGDKAGQVIMDDREPKYEIDEERSQLYFISGSNEIKGFAL